MDLHHTQILKSLGYSDPYPRYSELQESCTGLKMADFRFSCSGSFCSCDQVILTVSLFLFSHTAQAGAEISTVNPEQYSKRFLDFIGHILT